MRLPILWRASLRHLVRHPAQMGLSILGVALGVAVVVAIDLANGSAQRAFHLSSEAVNGRATHQVTGGPTGLPDELFRRLFVEAGATAAPVVEDYVAHLEPGGPPGAASGAPSRRHTLHLLGVDPLLERPFRPFLSGRGGGPAALSPLLTRPGAVLLSRPTAAELRVAPGGTLALLAGGKERTVEIAGLLEPADASARQALTDLLICDLATAQELLGRVGTLDRIDLLVPEGPRGEALLARIGRALPAGAELEATGARTAVNEGMTRAFRTNLTALSLLALVCGAFLIFNTMTFSVVQRRALLGTLRTLGVTRGQILALVLGEAAAVAAAGTALGLAAGVALGRGLIRLVTQTINDLYFVVSVRALAVPTSALVSGALLGLGATLLAALVPAIEAAAAPPRGAMARSELEGRVRRALPKATALAVLLLALGTILFTLPTGAGSNNGGDRGLTLAFGGLFAVIVGFALLAPVATAGLMALLRRPLGRAFGAVGRLAAGSVAASLSRSAVAIAALTVAVSVTVGVGVMVGSFRQSVVRWLDRSLAADIYVASPGRGLAGRTEAIAPALALAAERLPGVRRAGWIRRVTVAGTHGPVRLVAFGGDRRGQQGFELTDGDPETFWPAFARGSQVAVSEPFARRTATAVGALLRLRTALGDRDFRVGAIYRDFASDQGTVLIDRDAYVSLWGDRSLSGFSLDVAADTDLDVTVARLRALLGAEQALAVQPNRTLKRLSLAVFDRTFRITDVLRLLAGLVAAIGILAALLALELERGQEIGVLRASGMTPRQVAGMVVGQTALMGLTAGLLALPVGLSLSAIMVYVINRRSFGWTVGFAPQPAVLAGALLLALAAALLAGIYPAIRMARISPAAALRGE